MAKYIKILALFVVCMVALAGTTRYGVSDEQEKLGDVSAVSFQKEGQVYVGLPQFPFSPVAEIADGLQLQHISSCRLQRAQLGQYLLSLKSVVNILANIQASLSCHSKRDCSVNLAYSHQPPCEYYVFALRHIII